MLVSGDLGFSWLLLVVLSFPVVAFVIRRKWRLALAREEEIRRLLFLASEEAARAELEASAEYGSFLFAPPPQPPPLHPQCAVCYSPTTTRCARCKAVRYCSGKCQIIHWRQGHKHQCHPPNSHNQNNEDKNFSHRIVKEGFGSYEPEGKGVFNHVGRLTGDPLSTSPSHSSEVSFREEDISVHQPPSDETRNSIISKPPASLQPATSNKLSVDSPVGGAGSTSFEISKRNTCLDVAADSNEASTSFNSVDSCTSFTVSSVHESQSDSTASTDSDIDVSNVRSCDDPSTSTVVMKESLNSSSCKKSDNSKFSFIGAADGSSAETGGFLRFSFNLSGDATPYSQGSKPKPAATMELKKPIDGVTLSQEHVTGVAKVKTPRAVGSENNIQAKDNYITDMHDTQPREVSSPVLSACCANTSVAKGNSVHTNDMGNRLPNLSSNTAGHIARSMSSDKFVPTSKEVDSLSTSSASGAHTLCGTARRSASCDMSAKVNNDPSCAATLHYPPKVSNGLKTSMLKVVDHIRPSKKNYQGLFPYELFVRLYNWKKVEVRPCGLTNCGNSCYANVVLQCLAFTPPLTAYLLQGFHSKACGKREWCFTCEFESLIMKVKEGRSPLSPIGILSQLRRISSNLSNGKEEDAHEFLRYVVDTMQSVCFKEAGIKGSTPLEDGTTLVGLTFGGYLRSKIQCTKCDGTSKRYERMMDLTLEIEGDIGSLEEALRKFTGTESLDGENKYNCSRCKSYEKAKKKFTVWEAPNVLTIALKRFQTGKFGKLNKSIEFPEILDLAPYMSGTSDKSPVYSLYGVVVHLDIMNAAFSGHYVCYVKNAQNKWFMIDDSNVKAVEKDRVLAKGAYMLFYARCSPRAPKSIRGTVVSQDAMVKKPPEVKNSLSRSTLQPPWNHSNGRAAADCFHPGETRIRRIFDMDSSSDNSSLISGSDEGSVSTESNRDSTSTDDFSEYLFGESGYGWNSPYRGSSDLDASLSTSSSSSSLFSRHSSLSDFDSCNSSSPEAAGSRGENAHAAGGGGWTRGSSVACRHGASNDKGQVANMYSDTNKPCRKLASSCGCRETNSDRLGWANAHNYKSSVSFRR